MADRGNFIYEIDSAWSIFLDRDGVINQRIIGGYVETINQFEFIPGVLEAIFYFDSMFNHIFVVTNQQGVGKGIMTHDDLRLIHDYLLYEVKNAHGRIDEIYYSPDLAHSLSFNRKPQIGMAIQATNDYQDVDLNRSIMVGDSLSDMEFGRNAGMYTILAGEKNEKIPHELYDLRVDNLYSFSVLLRSVLGNK